VLGTKENNAGPGEAGGGGTYSIRVERHGLQPLLVLAGDIGLEAAADLRAEAERLLAGSASVALDWGAARHVCASAAQVLLALQAALSTRGRTLEVVRDNADVRRFLELAGLSLHFRLMELAA